jgi:hypothetical protein
MVVSDKEELPKQAFFGINSWPSKWDVIVLSTTCAIVMVEGVTRKQNLLR